MSEIKFAGYDWRKIQPGDLIICSRTRNSLIYFPERVGKMGILIKRGERSSKRVESDLVLVDGEIMRIDLKNWESVK